MCLPVMENLAEGQIWEAANFAAHEKLDNLVAILDINRLGQSQETMFGHHIDEYVRKFEAFDFEVIAIDGHNYKEINQALQADTKPAWKTFCHRSKNVQRTRHFLFRKQRRLAWQSIEERRTGKSP